MVTLLGIVYTQVPGFISQLLTTDSVTLMTYSVSDNIVIFTPAPTPVSHSSLVHRFMGFCHNLSEIDVSKCHSI